MRNFFSIFLKKGRKGKSKKGAHQKDEKISSEHPVTKLLGNRGIPIKFSFICICQLLETHPLPPKKNSKFVYEADSRGGICRRQKFTSKLNDATCKIK